MINKIVSKQFRNLNLYAQKKQNSYKESKPYPHIVVKNFFKTEFLDNVLNEFPNLEKISSSINYKNKNEVKFTNNKKRNLKKNTKKIFDFLNSKNFTIFLQTLTSIDEKILPDPYLSGGGFTK